jgi:hypothetical protein
LVSRPSVQKTVDVVDTGIASVNNQIRKVVDDALQKETAFIEKTGESSAALAIRLLAQKGGNMSMGGKSIGVRPAKTLLSGALGRLLSDKALVGELGIPDPREALKRLQETLPEAVSVRVRVSKGQVTIFARFNPERLIRLNPHPGKTFPNGGRIPIESWLQWTVGPRFDKRGTPGFAVARVQDILDNANRQSRSSMQIRRNITRASRTLGFSGGSAGIMLRSTRGPKGGKSPYETFTRRTPEEWTPRSLGRDFWTQWWKSNSAVIKDVFSQIIQIVMEQALKRQLG